MKEKIVCVEWEDASYDSGYYDKDKPQNFNLVITHSVGHLIKRNRMGVVLSMERFYSPSGQLESERHINTIPHKMIKKITYLREAEAKDK